MYEDIYFLDFNEALKIATQQNRWGDNGYFLQACYYNGEKQESELVNLIHLPIDNLLEELAYGTFRIPTEISFANLNLSESVKIDIELSFNSSIEQVQLYRKQLNLQYLKNLQNAKPDFNEPLRFYIPASSSTQVMQYVSKNIADGLKYLGYDVLFNLYTGIEDLSSLKKIYEYNPHVTININQLNNTILNKDIFNFIWFQDPMPILLNNELMPLRDRDFIFSYTATFTKLILKKGVSPKKIFKQEVIPLNDKEFFIDKNITREDKVVFVGSYYIPEYINYIPKYINENFINIIEQGKSLTEKAILHVYKSYNLQLPKEANFINYVQHSYIRNITVNWLSHSKNKKVEIYGYKWKLSPFLDVIANYKGNVKKENLNLLYNTTKYVLATSGQVINTQRLGEIVHAGAIPIVYDSRDITKEEQTWDDECLYFKTEKELHYILDNNIKPKKYRTKEMLEYFTYNDFLNKILQIIKKTLSEER